MYESQSSYSEVENKMTYCPNFNKILQTCHRDKEGIKYCMEQKEQKELIIPETNTIIDPWAMMIHLQATTGTQHYQMKILLK